MSSDVLGEQLVELRSFYRTGEEIHLALLPGHCERVVACRASSEVFSVVPAGGEATLRDNAPSGTDENRSRPIRGVHPKVRWR